MNAVKWVKLTTDMFDNRKIKYLRGLPEGNNIVLIWVMLLTMAGRCNANGYIFLTESVPYSPQMLANELGFPENTIQVALRALESMEMLTIEEDTLMIPGWEEHQNTAALEQIRESNRKRQARYREQAKGIETATPKEDPAQESNKEVENKRDTKKAEETKAARMLFEHLWGLYPNKKGKGQVSDTTKKKLLKIGKEELERAIIRYKAELEKEVWLKPQYGSTFFNSGYVDYLDENYVPGEPKRPKKKENKFNNFEQRNYDFESLERGLLG